MSEFITVARPYAKAAFDFAVEHQSVERWQDMLASRKVKLNCKIDKSVMAGVIIRAGDMVIDGSVRGRLERLADVLQS